MPAFAFPAIAGIHLPTSEGRKAELASVLIVAAFYIADCLLARCAGEQQRSGFPECSDAAKQSNSSVQLASGPDAGRSAAVRGADGRRRLSTLPRRRTSAAARHAVPRQPRPSVRRRRSRQLHVPRRRRRRDPDRQVDFPDEAGTRRPFRRADVGGRRGSAVVRSPAERARPGPVCPAARSRHGR